MPHEPKSLGERIRNSSDEELLAWLGRADPTSAAWSGITAELKYRAAQQLTAAVERLAKSSRQMESYTITLIRLQWATIGLTGAYLIFAICTVVFHRSY
jgi:hypothetical protein